MTTYQLQGVRVEVDPEAMTVITTFPDGELLVARPNYGDEDVARAQALGYDDVWEMTAHHDLLHTVVAQAQGQDYSLTLHAAATGEELGPRASAAAREEEAVVLLIQCILNQGLSFLKATS